MSVEKQDVECEEDCGWDRTLTWRDVPWILSAAAPVAVTILFDHYIRPLAWWQQTIGFLVIIVLACLVSVWIRWRKEGNTGVFPLRAAGAISTFAMVAGILVWLLLSGANWLIDRYSILRSILGAAFGLAFLAFVIWGIVESAKIRRERRQRKTST